MKKYDNYQVSPMLWNNAFPGHWRFERGKNLYRKENRPTSSADKVVTCFRDGTVTLRQNRRTTGFTESIQEIGYQGIRKGDLVIHVMDAFAGSIGVSASDGKGTPVYSVCTAKGDANNYYYAYLLREIARRGYIQSLYRGIRERSSDFRFEIFATQFYPVPPRAEQDQIVRFLDWKTSRINRLINTYRKEIDKLEELKRSRIGDLVMGATHHKKRQSEVSWVKTIPRHWGEAKLIQVAHEQKIKNTGLVEKNLLSLSYGKIVNKDINTTDGLLPASFEGYQIVRPGNVILRLTDLQNDHKSLRTGYVTQTGIITSAYTCIKHRENISPEYLQLQLHTADLCKVFYGMGGGVRQSIGFDDIKKLVIALPPLSEQVKIVEKAHGIDARINTVASKYKGVISLLKEYKNHLVSDVVTGQIDVRAVAIPEYERVEEVAEEMKSEGI